MPYVLGGKDPLAALWSIFSSKVSVSATPRGNTGNAAQEPAVSKRQAKLQKRMEKGDPRVQTRQR